MVLRYLNFYIVLTEIPYSRMYCFIGLQGILAIGSKPFGGLILVIIIYDFLTQA